LEKYDELFTCQKCKNPFIVGVINIVKDNAVCKCACVKGHKMIVKLPMSDKVKWIVPLTKHVYLCYCGAELTDLKMSSSGEVSNILLYCKKHKERSRKIDTIIWNSIVATKTKLSESLLEIDEQIPSMPPNSQTIPSASPLPKQEQPVNAIPETPIAISPPQNQSSETKKANFCSACGELIPEESLRFCVHCGSEL